MKNILITGGAGYIGSVLVHQLFNLGFKVTCVDKLMFGQESISDLNNKKNFIFYDCDITNFHKLGQILQSDKFDAVIHLASIVGDPACKLYKNEAYKTNWQATCWLVDKCISLGISRFIFSSTCSNYGKMENKKVFVDENSPLKPLSLYAELKVKVENYILNEIIKTDSFNPTVLRFPTVYGPSKRMRFDLTVNEFSKEISLGRKLLVFGKQFWRPYCHVEDFANAFISVLNSPIDTIAYNVFNVGSTSENYTKKMIVDLICREIPSAKIEYIDKDEDPRDYRVNSDKIYNNLGFRTTKDVQTGIREIIDLIRSNHYNDTEDQKYYNIPHNNV